MAFWDRGGVHRAAIAHGAVVGHVEHRGDRRGGRGHGPGCTGLVPGRVDRPHGEPVTVVGGEPGRGYESCAIPHLRGIRDIGVDALMYVEAGEVPPLDRAERLAVQI